MEMDTYPFILQLSTVRVIGILIFFIKLSFEFLFPDKRKMVKILIDARPDTIDVKNVNGTTPLILACDKGITMLIMMFLLEWKTKTSSFVLLSVVNKMLGHDDVAVLLIKNNADINATDSIKRQTPLELAAKRGELKIIVFFYHVVQISNFFLFFQYNLFIAHTFDVC